MSDRATYLARTILSRMRALDGVIAEDGMTGSEEAEARRSAALRKVLAVEEGATFGPTVETVMRAVPRTAGPHPTSDRDLAEFVAVLKRELKL